MATLFELIESKVNQICDKVEYSSDLKVDKGVKYLLDFINERLNHLKLEEVNIKIEKINETPYVKNKWRILSFVINDEYFDFSVLVRYFNAIIEHFLIFADSRTEKLFLDETIRVTTKENKIIFVQNDNTTPNRIEMETDYNNPDQPNHFIVKIYQTMN